MSKDLNKRHWKEIDLSDVLNKIETHSKNSCHYFFENSTLRFEKFSLKKEDFDVITN
jgi:hypothetical protein